MKYDFSLQTNLWFAGTQAIMLRSKTLIIKAPFDKVIFTEKETMEICGEISHCF